MLLFSCSRLLLIMLSKSFHIITANFKLLAILVFLFRNIRINRWSLTIFTMSTFYYMIAVYILFGMLMVIQIFLLIFCKQETNFIRRKPFNHNTEMCSYILSLSSFQIPNHVECAFLCDSATVNRSLRRFRSDLITAPWLWKRLRTVLKSDYIYMQFH